MVSFHRTAAHFYFGKNVHTISLGFTSFHLNFEKIKLKQ